MKSSKIWRAAPGMAIAVAVVAVTSASAYAVTNWFNANVTARQNDSVLSVDLTGCKGNLPSGIEDGADRSNVKFKILGDPHISVNQLQNTLLADCELSAVLDTYRSQSGNQNYSYYPSEVKAINNDGTVKLDYFWAGSTNQKEFALAPDAAIYNQGTKIGAEDLSVGDKIVFVVKSPLVIQEGSDPLGAVIQIDGIFKTQYDTRQASTATKNAFYETSNIRPLN